MKKPAVEPSPWLGTLAIRLPMDILGDLYHAAHEEETDPASLVGRILSDYLSKNYVITVTIVPKS